MNARVRCLLLSVLTSLVLSSPAGAALLARWDLDDGPDPGPGDNLTAANSVTGYDGTLTNMDDTNWTADTPSGSGYALEFGGGNQYVNVPDHAEIDLGTSNAAVSFWVKRNSIGTFQGVWDHEAGGGGDPGHQGLFMTDNTFRVRLDSGAPDVLMDSSDTITNDGQWHHVLVSVDRSQTTGGRMYIDGALQPTQYNVTGIGDLTNGQDLWIGQFNNNFFLDGKLDDLQIYDQALPRSLALYQIRHPGTAIELPPVVPGPWLNYDAAEPGTAPSGTTGTWATTTGNTGRPWTWTPTTAPAYVPDTAFVPSDGFPGIAAAYAFDGTAVAECGNYQSMQTESATFEVWFRPSDASGQEILLEIGGTAGTSIFLDDADVHFLTKGTTAATANLVAAGALGGWAPDDFIQVVGVIDMDATQTQLYVNGLLADEASSVPNLWTGSDGNGLAGPNNLIGGEGGFDFTGYGNFAGEIAIYRWYRSALTPDQILQNYEAVAVAAPVPEPSTWVLMMVGLAALAGLGLRRRAA